MVDAREELLRDFAMPALARDPSNVVSVAGTVDDVAGRPGQNQRRDGGDGRVGKRAQGGVGPAGLDLGVVVERCRIG